MNIISFPNLGLEFKISPIAFSIFDIDIYWYSICIVFGIVIAIILCSLSKEKFGIKFEDILDISVIALVLGIIGARFYYIIFNLEYYALNPIKIFSLRDGGLSIIGGLLFGGLGVVLRAKKLSLKVYNVLDYIIPFVALAQSFGRWGNFFNAEAYGVECENFFKMGIKNLSGYKEVHPTFLYESICTFVIFCILRILQKNRKFSGQIVFLYLIFYSVCRFFIESIRVDALMFKGIKITKFMCVISMFFSLYVYLKKKKILHMKKN